MSDFLLMISLLIHVYIIKGYNVGWFWWSMFSNFVIKFVCFVVAMSDLLHDVEAINDICLLLTASENLF